jgi:four helix bundle protein
MVENRRRGDAVLKEQQMSRIYGDLKERTMKFSEAILAAVDYLPDGNKGWVVGRQLVRSGTSIGSNLYEADHAISDADFAHKCSVARREASETMYWLELCRRTAMIPAEKAAGLTQEADEMLRILAAMVKRTQERMTQS